MNNKKFVFVLGAGASNDFGYPTGDKLIEEISEYRHDGIFTQFMEALGFSSRDINIFCEKLKYSGLNTIDAFLSRAAVRQDKLVDFENIGRACITYNILYHEKMSRETESVFRFNENWYRYIFSFFPDKYEALVDGRVRFLTFNYDLTLEHFIAESYRIRNYLYVMDESEQTEFQSKIGSIKILHLYGHVGDLIEFDSVGRKYGFDMLQIENYRVFNRIAKGIEIVRPDISARTQDIFKKAQEYLSAADYIFFIGFGFDSLNMERLELHQVFQKDLQDKLLYATVYGADNSSIYDFEDRICPDEGIRKNIYTRGEKDEKIVSFLKNKCFILSQLKD